MNRYESTDAYETVIAKIRNVAGGTQYRALACAALVCGCVWTGCAQADREPWTVSGDFKVGDVLASSAVTTGICGVVSRQTTVRNISGRPVTVKTAFDCWTFADGDWEVYTQSNEWQKESVGRWRDLAGTVETCSGKMRVCDGATPMLAIWDRHTKTGRVFQALPSGEWLLRAVRTNDGVTVEVGYNPKYLRWQLAPGETMTLPEVLAYPCGSRADLDCHRLHAYWNARTPAAENALAPIYNTWLCRFDRLDLPFVLRQVGRAREIGFTYFVVDAGWFGPKASWSSVRGDWEERDDGWLGGRLADVSKAVRAAGMKFGFWVEAECADASSRIIREHPDWFFKADGMHFLDFRKPSARNALLETVCSLVKKYDASFLKFDFNQTAREDPSGRVWTEYNEAYRRFVGEVRARHPGIYLEGCASGGHMMDLGWSRTFDGFWLSDNQNAYAGVRIVKDTMLRLPPRYLERWFTLLREEGLQPDYNGRTSRLLTTEDATWTNYRTLAPSRVDAFAASGPFCMSCNLLTFNRDDISHFQGLIRASRNDASFWKAAVGRILVDTPELTVLQYSDAARTDVRLVFVPSGLTASATVFPSVDANLTYAARGKTRTGADIIRTGIPVNGGCQVLSLKVERNCTWSRANLGAKTSSRSHAARTAGSPCVAPADVATYSMKGGWPPR